MTASPGTTSSNDVMEKLRTEIFTVTRSTGFTDSEKQRELCRLICNHGNPSMQEIANHMVNSDRTGWKEATGKLCAITGYSTHDLGIGEGHSEKIFAFGGKESNLHKKSEWDAKVKKTFKEVTNANHRIALTS